ncbi:hypothetical protein DPEC_G00100380 [Dallia pectoralis]|uniref:Uncharacterized protein n=1 Tax=Dallia pectoralis TaxID=75939 RepID=A0ACC2GXH0_DALPE|nr:hypothetical protein DPEC_G00100380 [Dallia pectoralis]
MRRYKYLQAPCINIFIIHNMQSERKLATSVFFRSIQTVRGIIYVFYLLYFNQAQKSTPSHKGFLISHLIGRSGLHTSSVHWCTNINPAFLSQKNKTVS